MTRNPSKLVLAMAALLAVWVAVFWLYPARSGAAAGGGISYGEPPDMAGVRELVATEQVKPPEPVILKPMPAAPLPGQPEPQPAAPTRLVKRLIPPEFTDYTVQKGDASFAAVSLRFYGTAKHADAISRANPYVSPSKLVAGRTRLRIPKDPENIQGRIEMVPEAAGSETPAQPGQETTQRSEDATHTVQPGETLGAISKRYYGTTTRWKAILEANSDTLDKPEKLRAGMTLRIPPKD